MSNGESHTACLIESASRFRPPHDRNKARTLLLGGHMPETQAAAVPSASFPQAQILEIMSGHWKSRAVAVAAELELADLLAEGPVPVETLASRTHTDTLSLFRLTRALESIGIFKQSSSRVFANTPASDCLRKNLPGSQWGIVRSILSVGSGQYEAWNGLLGSVQTGKTAFDEMHGCSLWEWFKRNPEVWTAFNQGLASFSAINAAVTNALDWSRFGVIADIGGGIGGQLVDILNAYPSCRGILFDQPGVVSQAIAHDRMEAIGGDFFKHVPEGADAYSLRMIIHDWTESEAMTILRNIREVATRPSRIALI